MNSARNLFANSFCASLLLLLTYGAAYGAQNSDELIKDARILYKSDTQYMEARLKHQWENIYSFQHPDYQKAISFEEFKYFNGRIAINYRQDKRFHHLSGVPSYPSVATIKKNSKKAEKDWLGIPIPTLYSLQKQKARQVESYELQRIYMDESGSLARVKIKLSVSEDHSVPLRTHNLIIKLDTIFVDYWEKVDGRWVIPVMKLFPGAMHISGSKTKDYNYPIPEDKSRWDNAKFTEFNAKELN